jgi:hypothetical protein
MTTLEEEIIITLQKDTYKEKKNKNIFINKDIEVIEYKYTYTNKDSELMKEYESILNDKKGKIRKLAPKL